MPPVAAPARVLVTGASGFLATHVIRNLLQEGFTVVGTVRSSPKGDHLATTFNSDRFSYVIVEDIEKADAFDEVVESGNFDAIEHTASPFHFTANDPQELIGPAVAGTINILASVLKFGPEVKRVVITSSTSAVISDKEGFYRFTEDDWNEQSPKVVKQLGAAAPQGHKYDASKVLAERAAWDFMSTHASEARFDLVVINPPYIFGPTIHETRNIQGLNESNALFRRALLAKRDEWDTHDLPLPALSQKSATAYQGNYVDVRTVAVAHTRALQVAEAGGNRFIVSSGPLCWQDVYDALNEAGINSVPRGFPGAVDRAAFNVQDGSKAARVLGLEYLRMPTTAVDTLRSIQERFPGSVSNSTPGRTTARHNLAANDGDSDFPGPFESSSRRSLIEEQSGISSANDIQLGTLRQSVQ